MEEFILLVYFVLFVLILLIGAEALVEHVRIKFGEIMEDFDEDSGY